jgi:hypothetical protein
MGIEARLVPLVDEGLGNSAYLLDVGDGRALAVDPPRDLRALCAAAGKRGLTVVWAADTHLHADFLSGAVQLAATDGADILASAAGMRAFDHRGLADGDEVDLGGLTLRALPTAASPSARCSPGSSQTSPASAPRSGSSPPSPPRPGCSPGPACTRHTPGPDNPAPCTPEGPVTA